MDANCLIIAGEKSGEEHCLSFFSELLKNCPGVKFWGVGGDEMAACGFENLYHLKDFSSWGVSEVIGKIPFYFKALKTIENDVVRRGTKVAILIDFQDFNLRLAKRLKKKGVKVLYYVAPQAWAWKAWRARVLEETVHTLFTIIPFEKNWFGERGVRRIVSVNHPLWLTYKGQLESSELGKEVKTFENFKKEIKILLLPGSRNFEVEHLLPEFINAIKDLKKEFNLKIGIVKSSNVKEDHYLVYERYFDEVFSNDKLAQALKKYDFALAASGTVTLATALFEVPTIVAYKSSLLNEFIFYTFLDYRGHISLANIVHEKDIFPELIQNEATSYNIKEKLLLWLRDKNKYDEIKDKLSNTAGLLQGDESHVGEYMSHVVNDAYEK